MEEFALTVIVKLLQELQGPIRFEYLALNACRHMDNIKGFTSIVGLNSE